MEKDKPLANDGADFETAITESGFGLFNILLLLITLPSVFSLVFEITTLSYVFPAAQCDLDLTLQDKGIVNAVIFAGMISSAFVWGSLVDVFGRQKILVVAHFLNFIFVLMTTFTPSLTFLIVSKYFGGFAVNGAAMALTPYLSEFHKAYYRCRVPLTIGLIYNIGSILLPLLAWAFLPLTLHISTFEIRGWNLFLFVCTLPTLISGLIFVFMPESPKYLMSKGNNAKALKIFETVFRINTKSKDAYPIKKLADEQQIHSKKHSFKEAWKQLSPLFTFKYIPKLLAVCFIVFGLMFCVNSLRLWLPQIFQIINDFEEGNKTFCAMVNTISQNTTNTNQTQCSMNFNNSSVYINSVIVGVVTVVSYGAAACIIKNVGKKKLLKILSAASVGSIYFSPNILVALILICIHLAAACVCIDTVVTVVVDLFPTSLRALALSTAIMSGRTGCVIGNLIFPFLLEAGCAAQFFTLAAVVAPLFLYFYHGLIM